MARIGWTLALFAGLALAAPGFAATPEQVARKAARAGAAQALAGFRADEAAVRANLESNLAAIEDALAAPFDALTVASEIGESIGFYQRDVSAAQDEAILAMATAHSTAMTDFATATGNAPFPPDLLAGSGGAADRFRDGLRAAVAKSLGKVRKRLARTQAALRAAGLRSTVRLEPARPETEQAPNVNGAVAVGVAPLTIDLLVAVTVVDPPAGGGFVVAGGQARQAGGDVTVRLDGSDGQEVVVTPGITQRWAAAFGNVDVVDLGNEIATARQGATGSAASLAIGVP